MSNVISLSEQFNARHPKTGEPVIVVGVDTSQFIPRLVILCRGSQSVSAEIVDYVDRNAG